MSFLIELENNIGISNKPILIQHVRKQWNTNSNNNKHTLTHIVESDKNLLDLVRKPATI